MFVFFFFKQKTAYEMRISDWSSDVALPILPSFNVNLHPTDNIILRGAIAKVITRPTLGSLTPGGSVDQFNFRITSGNPFLEPYRATTFDLAAEWYFAPGAIASVALFAKDIDSFPIGPVPPGNYATNE